MKKIIGLMLAVSMFGLFLVGCSGGKDTDVGGKVVDLNEIHKAVKDQLGEDYTSDRELLIEELEPMVGVDKSDIETYIAEAPMISVGVDTFIAIKAKEGKADGIEQGLQNHKKFLMEESFQYPMNIAKVNASKVIRHGDYVFFVMLGAYDDREDATEEERLEFAQAETKKVEETINGFFK